MLSKMLIARVILKRQVRLAHRSTKLSHHSQLKVSENLKWSTYKSPCSRSLISIAEVCDIDCVFEDAIQHNLPEPFGIITWDSSYLAADILDACLGEKLLGKKVCDLGCGTGLTSLLCMSHGAHVISLDNNEVSLALCAVSRDAYISQHDTVGTMTTMVFDLEGPNKLPACDVLVVSDLLYYEKLAQKVAERVYEAVKCHSCTVLITDPGRLSADTFTRSLANLLQNTAYASQLRFIPYVVDAVSKGNYMLLK